MERQSDGGASVQAIEVEALEKRFGSVTAVNSLSFHVAQGEILVLLGSSGCGKTTTLRCIAGLEDVSGGEIRIAGEVVASRVVHVPPERRGVGMVFQSYALWPHMTVRQNVGYGLRLARVPRGEMDARVEAALETVGLKGMESRYPFELSGGQQQRVALARGIVTRPRVLLLAEPLSNLDAKLREQMRDELRDLIKEVGITSVYITHDQTEAMVIADRVIVMNDGVAVEEAAPRDLYRAPRTRFAAQFVGMASFVSARAVRFEGQSQRALFRSEDGLEVWASGESGLQIGQAVTLMIRPEHVALGDGTTGMANRWVGHVTKSVFLGATTEYEVTVGAHVLRAHAIGDAELGEEVAVGVAARDVHWLVAD